MGFRPLIVSLFILALHASHAHAQHGYAAAAASLALEADSLLKQINEGKLDAQAALNKARAGILRLENELDPGFSDAVSEIIGNLDSPSATELRRLKDELAKDIEKIRGTYDEKDSKLKRNPGELRLDDIGPHVRPVFIAYARAGYPEAAVDLFEIVAAYHSLPTTKLILTHIGVMAEKRVLGMPWESYLWISDSAAFSRVVGHIFFPELPDFTLGRINGYRWNEKESIERELGRFTSVFESHSAPADAASQRRIGELQARVGESLRVIQRSISEFENYRRVFFYRRSEDEIRREMLNAIFTTPGADDCLLLASQGTSIMDGTPCRPALFRRKLDEYLSYLGNVADFGVMEALQRYVVEYRAAEPERRARALETLKFKVKNLGRGNVTPNIRENWPKVAAALLDDVNEGPSPFLRLLDQENASVPIFQILKSVLLANRIEVRSDIEVNEKMGLTAFASDKSEQNYELMAVKSIQQGFINNVEAPLLGSSIAKDPSLDGKIAAFIAKRQGEVKRPLTEGEKHTARLEAIFGLLESKLKRFDASQEFCPLFLSPSLTREQKIAASPWVVASVGVNERDAQPQESANATQRLHWFHNSSFSNAFTIQNEKQPDETFAGLAVRFSVATTVPNLVQARMLMEDFEEELPGTTLSDYGLIEAQASVVSTADAQFPSYEKVIAASRVVFKQTLLDWALRLGKIDKKLSHEERVKEFTATYKALLAEYGQQYRRDLESAALAVRKWDEKIAKMKSDVYSHVTQKGGPSLFEELLIASYGPEKGRAMFQWMRNAHLIDQHSPAMNIRMQDMMSELHAHSIGQSIEAQVKREFPKLSDKDRAARTAALRNSPEWRGRTLNVEEFMRAFFERGQQYFPKELWKDLVGNTDGNAKVFSPRALPALYEGILNQHQRQLEFAEYARDLILYRFPALKVVDPSRWDKALAWTGRAPKQRFHHTYDGSEVSYRKCIRAYYENSKRIINLYQALGGGKDFAHQEVKAILDVVMYNLPLLDMILRYFPQHKQFVCAEQARRQITQEDYDLYMGTLGVSGGVCAAIGLLGMIPSLGLAAAIPGINIIAAAGVVILAVHTIAESYESYQKHKRFDEARAWETAASGQMGFSEFENNLDHLREMEKSADAAYSGAVFSAALTTVSFVPGAKTLKGAAVSVRNSGVGSYTLAVLRRGFLFTARGRRTAAAPIKRMGLFADWTRDPILTKLHRVFFSPIYSSCPVTATVEVGSRAAYELAPYAFNFWPKLLTGSKWANTWRGTVGQVAIEGGPYLLAGGYALSRMWSQAGVKEAFEYAESDPNYQDLFHLMRMGHHTHGEIVGIIQSDLKLKQIYMTALEKEANKIQEYAYSSGGGDAEAQTMVANSQENLKAIHTRMVEELQKIGDGGTFHPHRAALERQLEVVEQVLNSNNVKVPSYKDIR